MGCKKRYKMKHPDYRFWVAYELCGFSRKSAKALVKCHREQLEQIRTVSPIKISDIIKQQKLDTFEEKKVCIDL